MALEYLVSIVKNGVTFSQTVQLNHLFELLFVIGSLVEHQLFQLFMNWYRHLFVKISYMKKAWKLVLWMIGI